MQLGNLIKKVISLNLSKYLLGVILVLNQFIRKLKLNNRNILEDMLSLISYLITIDSKIFLIIQKSNGVKKQMKMLISLLILSFHWKDYQIGSNLLNFPIHMLLYLLSMVIKKYWRN